jgi:hypothetical protein
MNKKTLVIGASPNPDRFAHKAVRALRSHGHDVVALGLRHGMIGDVPIVTELVDAVDFDTVTLYLGPQRQPDYYEIIRELHPKRVIFNPGTENPEFERTLQQAGIETVEDCTLVLLASKRY